MIDLGCEPEKIITHRKGTPVVLMEAMASGLPVVSTYHGGIPELVRDGVTGFLVEERNSEALADKMEVLINNPELRRDFGKKGRENIVKNFNSNKLNNEMIDIYWNLSKEGEM